MSASGCSTLTIMGSISSTYVQIFDGRPTFTYHSPRRAEDRWGTVAIVKDRFYLVVWTKRGERRRIISAYRADDWEIREYRKLYG